jgi:crossover junction endodeoxyribonuclease RusA
MVESSKQLAPWRTTVAWHVAQHWKSGPLGGAVCVDLNFVLPRPASTPKKTTPPAIKRPDADKLTRAVFDALTGVCWRDDSQIIDFHTSKRLAELDELPGVQIEIVGDE